MKGLLVTLLGLFAFTLAQNSQLLKDFSNGYNKFSAGVYRELLKSNSANFLVCPLSLDIVLALVNAGAKGQTASEITSTLHLPETTEKANELFSSIAPHLQSNDKYELSSANKVYVKEGFQISDGFRDTAVKSFNAEIQAVDFAKSSEAAAEINKWVEDKTHEKIKNLIQPGYLDEFTRSVLVNAIYFHGKWVHGFEKQVTEKKPFYAHGNKTVDTDTMVTFNTFEYYESSELNAKFIKLPYEGGDVALHIVLPNDKDGLAALEAKLEDVMVAPKYSSYEVEVQMPKFKIESKIDFGEILQTLGVRTAFSDESADFTGIAADKQRLVISKVLQKTFIDVDEEGTTAAAATGVIVAIPISAPIDPTPPKQFIADHPFIFYLRLEKLGVNLFVGAYKSP